MKYSLHLAGLEEVKKLAKEVNLYEDLDENCCFLGIYNGKLIGAAGVNRNTNLYPRFEHIIIAKKYQKSRLAVRLMFAMEEYLKSWGYKGYTAFILNTKKQMQAYAKKWMMMPFEEKENGIWFYKSLS